MNKPVRIGFIGAGWWATVNNIPQIAAREDPRVAAVCGLDADVLSALKDRYVVPFVTADVGRLLEADLDGIVVSTPHHLHYEHALAALQRGFHVLCEKPMTLRASEAWTLVDVARENERHLVVGYGWNYKPPMRAAHQLMARGAVGEVRYVLCHMASPTLSLFAKQSAGPGAMGAEHRQPRAADMAGPRTRRWVRAWPDHALGGSSVPADGPSGGRSHSPLDKWARQG